MIKIKNEEVVKLAKRKAERNSLAKYTNTPKKNVQESEFAAEVTSGEDVMKFANRNSKQGRKGRA